MGQSETSDRELVIELDAEVIGWIDGRLRDRGFEPTDARRAGVAQALVRGQILTILMLPVEDRHLHEFGPWQNDVAGVVRECWCGHVEFRPEG